jgi:exodeoxyribonuclease-5
MKSITLTPMQETACAKAIASLKHRKHFTLGGYAGTGKTTILYYIREILRSERKRVAVMAPTGKAAEVLRNKGLTSASTIHQTIYKKISDSPLTFERRRKHEIEADVIICDESSMISKEILRDLYSLGIPILFVGDPYQLPPVGDDPELLVSCDFTLTEVHRQALDNPIISLATYLRSDPYGSIANWYSSNRDQTKVKIHYKKIGVKLDPTIIDQAIVGYNNTRQNVNRVIRKRLGFTNQYPQEGDRLICLRNDYENGVCNGQQFIALDDECNGSISVIDPTTEQQYILDLNPEVFTNPSANPKQCPRTMTPLDYAYAITCHKSQGSEFPTIAVIDEPIGQPSNRWRYTAITRASDTIHYFL